MAKRAEISGIDPFNPDYPNPNIVVTGESSLTIPFTKYLVLRHHLAGKNSVVVDPNRNFTALIQATGGLLVDHNDSNPHRFNPMELPNNAAEEDRFEDQIHFLQHFMRVAVADQTRVANPDAQDRVVADLAKKTYGSFGISEDPSTHDKPAPLLKNFFDHMKEADLGDFSYLVTASNADLLQYWYDQPTNIPQDVSVAFIPNVRAPKLHPLETLVAEKFSTNRSEKPQAFVHHWQEPTDPSARIYNEFVERSRTSDISVITTASNQMWLSESDDWNRLVLNSFTRVVFPLTPQGYHLTVLGTYRGLIADLELTGPEIDIVETILAADIQRALVKQANLAGLVFDQTLSYEEQSIINARSALDVIPSLRDLKKRGKRRFFRAAPNQTDLIPAQLLSPIGLGNKPNFIIR